MESRGLTIWSRSVSLLPPTAADAARVRRRRPRRLTGGEDFSVRPSTRSGAFRDGEISDAPIFHPVMWETSQGEVLPPVTCPQSHSSTSVAEQEMKLFSPRSSPPAFCAITGMHT
ncbi:hypothetical protein SKAU_G00046640 [Synaphobranchus kaupii]|uniref:Uncharacterized protein n=1 Tax=Synaphobranchus kaupii TaxID=118154 RepID=A0A9Q1J764_SYNKA|nr:hypothetical protein SKAU_G00046640 [Synaphobranchus kaupii]